MAVQEKLLTAEEFAQLPKDGKKYELVKGVVVEVCRPNYIHGKLQASLAYFLNDHVRKQKLGDVITETGHILARNPDTVRGPDVAFISKDRAKRQEPSGYVPSGPDLAVEIVSPNDTAKEINDKIKEYFQAGTSLIWVIYPDTKEVYVYENDSTTIQIVRVDSALDGADVLPGFTLALHDLFEDLES